MIAKNKNIKSKTKEIIKKSEGGNKVKPQNFFLKYFSFKSKIAQRIYIFVLTLAFIAAMLSYDYTPDIGIELDKPSPRTIKANKSIEFEDVEKTEEDRNKNEAGVEDIYVYDVDILNGEEGALYKIRYFYLLTGIVQKKEDKSFEEKVDYLTNLFGNVYSESTISAALNLSTEENNSLATSTQEVAKDIMEEKIKQTEVDFAKNEVLKLVEENEGINREHVPVAASVLQNNIEATALFDPVATEEARRDARLNTPSHMVNIQEGQTIIIEGEIVSDENIVILKMLGLLEKEFNWRRYVYMFLAALIVLLTFGFYIYKFNGKIFENTKKIFLISLLIVIFTAIIKILTILSSIHLSLWNYMFPVIAASMIFTILFDARLGIIATVSLAIFSGIATDFDFSIAIVYMLGGIFATYLVSNVSQRAEVMKGGFISSLILGSLFFTVNLIGGEATTIALYTILGVLNGIICAILTIGLMPFIESVFNIVTAMGLLELSHTDRPLLKELLIHAPGTYNHSLIVGHLAENSAKAIGADSLLVKVAALYHDIGKLRRPEYFYENQVDIENIHDRLNPSMSRNIIANHIKDGIEIAIKNKVPKKVINVISQHHGNSLITYFYEKQKNKDTIKTSNGSIEGLKGHFRYPTRKPQSREAAILMLADSTEAAVRSIERITPKKIEQMVDYVVEDKIKDGQLSESNITLKEISTIKLTLIDGLISIYHSRLTYTDSKLKVAGDNQ
jgi:putative nucleotidyltransferase with HDIG domain